jgi:F-box-like
MDGGTSTESLMDKISDEIFVKILSYVPHDNYLNMRLVDHRFNKVSKDSSLWKKVTYLKLLLKFESM